LFQAAAPLRQEMLFIGCTVANKKGHEAQHALQREENARHSRKERI